MIYIKVQFEFKLIFVKNKLNMEYTINDLSEIINNLNIFKSWEFTNKTVLTGNLNGIMLKLLTEEENHIDDFSKYQVSFSIVNNRLFVSFRPQDSNSYPVNYHFFVPVVNRFYEPHLFKVLNNMKFL